MRDCGQSAVVLARAALGAVAALACSGGCAQPPDSKRGILDENPAVKIPAIKRAGAVKDATQASSLVDQLTDEDAAIRFYAIEALKYLAGDDLGYHYYDDRPQRDKAVERWRQWLLTQQPAATAATQPTTRPAMVDGQ
ncbi:MAG: hypothetical protein ABSH20_06145 [Tepidisphaeraceae bacterium]|jgi:hypothetical protein